MTGTYVTGFQYVTGYAIAAGTYYPDPDGRDATPPANSDFLSDTATDSPFDGKDASAIIRSIYMHRAISGAPSLQIDNHDGTRRVWQALVSTMTFVLLPDINILVPGGFRITVAGAPFFTIAYEVNAS